MKVYPIKLQIPDSYFDTYCFTANLQPITQDDETTARDYGLTLYKDKRYLNRECYSYALQNFKLCDIEDGYAELTALYEQITIKDVKEGDIIAYYAIDKDTKGQDKPNELTIQHFARVMKVLQLSNKTCIKIKSKWGLNGIFEGCHDELPEFYGNFFGIYRRKK